MPVAAGLALLPMILNFEIAENYNFSPWAMAIYMIIIGFLMISTIPTFSSKKVSINKKYAAIFLLCIAMITAGMILEPWIILPLIGILYLCSIPFSIFYYYKYKRNNK